MVYVITLNNEIFAAVTSPEEAWCLIQGASVSNDLSDFRVIKIKGLFKDYFFVDATGIFTWEYNPDTQNDDLEYIYEVE